MAPAAMRARSAGRGPSEVRATGACAPALHLMLQLYRKTVEAGRGDEDFAAVFESLV